MMYRWVVLRKVVGQVFRAWCPKNVKLALVYTILQPVESHIDGFRFSLLDLLVCKTNSRCIVQLDGGGGLWVSHFLECGADLGSVLGVGESGSDF